jgi:hypothetical protein
MILIDQRNPDGPHTGEFGEDRVKFERTPRVHHFGSRLADCLKENLQQCDRTSAQRDLVLGDTMHPCDLSDQVSTVEVGIAVDSGRCRRDRLDDFRERIVWRLVGVERVPAPGSGQPGRVRSVGGKVVEYRA